MALALLCHLLLDSVGLVLALGLRCRDWDTGVCSLWQLPMSQEPVLLPRCTLALSVVVVLAALLLVAGLA